MSQVFAGVKVESATSLSSSVPSDSSGGKIGAILTHKGSGTLHGVAQLKGHFWQSRWVGPRLFRRGVSVFHASNLRISF